MKETSALKIVVAGDLTIDWHLRRIRRKQDNTAFWSADDSIHVNGQRGGCALLADLVDTIAKELNQATKTSCTIYQPAAPRNISEVCPGDEHFHHSFATWSLFKYGEKPPFDKEKPAWRVEEFLGLGRSNSLPEQNKALTVVDDPPDANLVVLDDADLGFRGSPEVWPAALKRSGKKRPWILLKMAKPVAQGSLWTHLHGECADRLIVVTTVNDLRLTEVQISRELSWERTAQDVFWELVHNPCVNALSHCAHVVVSFGTAGAILLSMDGKEKVAPKCFLFFDPKVIEGMWELNYPGGMIGYTSCLTAGVIRQLMLSPENPDIHLGIQAGLTALRALHLEGYGKRGAPVDKVQLAFPMQHVISVLAQEPNQFSIVEVQDPLRFIRRQADSKGKPLTAGFWTILQDRYQGKLDHVAEQIVLEGPEVALQGVPLGQFGDLLTVDRQEIESFRSIRSLVSEYCCQGLQKRPLSIAVFGSPGSGKSFGITEVAKSLLPGQIEVREFNLSQLGSPNDLLAAFHQVRDIGLSGKMPLVFWDEFDTTLNDEPLGWLRYFLAPMQDGRFLEGQISHPLGRSIFVFAGGTASSMAEFGHGLITEAFRSVKGPDFASRLKGYVNILGPNPTRTIGDRPLEDPYFIIRRAILLRSIFKRNASQLFDIRAGKEMLNIDRGVLRGLLQINQYHHGVRSIESIIATSRLAGKTTFERSSLPAESQLDLHVDGQNFLGLVQEIELERDILEDLAEATHEIYREGLKMRGVQTETSSVAYADLPENFKEQNRQNVRDIPAKLASAGYAMIPARSNEPPFNFPGDALERLAEMEHERWMQAKLADNWKCARKTNNARKLNQSLVPWSKLSQEEKEKDRDLVRGIPDILARAGFAIIKTRE